MLDDESRNNIDDTAITEIASISRLHCRIFACRVEEQAIVNIISFEQKDNLKDIQEDRRFYTGLHQFPFCRRCDLNIMNSSLRGGKVVDALLHTIHHGTISIRVIEFLRLKCGTYLHYDSSSDGVFRLTKDHLFSRELVDMWLWDVCGTGCTLCEACSSWDAK